MRICNKCKEKPVRNGQYTCKDCHNEYQKAYYKKHPLSIDKSAKERQQRIRDYIRSVKDAPCVDCNEKYPYYVMDFDHINGVKSFNLSIAANKFKSLKKIKDEIEKCEIVCSNCHRIRTFTRLGIGGIGNTSVFETEDSTFDP